MGKGDACPHHARSRGGMAAIALQGSRDVIGEGRRARMRPFRAAIVMAALAGAGRPRMVIHGAWQHQGAGLGRADAAMALSALGVARHRRRRVQTGAADGDSGGVNSVMATCGAGGGGCDALMVIDGAGPTRRGVAGGTLLANGDVARIGGRGAGPFGHGEAVAIGAGRGSGMVHADELRLEGLPGTGGHQVTAAAIVAGHGGN